MRNIWCQGLSLPWWRSWSAGSRACGWLVSVDLDILDRLLELRLKESVGVQVHFFVVSVAPAAAYRTRMMMAAIVDLRYSTSISIFWIMLQLVIKIIIQFIYLSAEFSCKIWQSFVQNLFQLTLQFSWSFGSSVSAMRQFLVSFLFANVNGNR